MLLIDYCYKYKKKYDVNSYLYISMTVLTMILIVIVFLSNIFPLYHMVETTLLFLSCTTTMLITLLLIYYLLRNYLITKKINNKRFLILYTIYFIIYLIILLILFNKYSFGDITSDAGLNSVLYYFNVASSLIPLIVLLVIYTKRNIKHNQFDFRLLLTSVILMLGLILDITFSAVYTLIMAYTMVLLMLYINKYSQIIYIDPLTNLYNRRFLENLNTENKITNSKGFLGVLVIDVDKFKKINDKYGHDKGDEILKEVSDRLYDSVRSSDYVIRYGGDEFLIIAKLAKEEDLKILEEKIQTNLNKYNKNNEIQIGLSIGSEVYKPGESKFSDIFKQADDKMYDIKKIKSK